MSEYKQMQKKSPTGIAAYVIFKLDFTTLHLNKLEVHTTFMYTYVYLLSISSYSLTKSQAHSSNYAHLRFTLEPQDAVRRSIEHLASVYIRTGRDFVGRWNVLCQVCSFFFLVCHESLFQM